MTQLRPLPPESFPTLLDTVVVSYANDNVASGRWLAGEALEMAKAETAALLPQGPDTPNQQLFEIEDESTGQAVGFLWFSTVRRGSQATAYLYQLIVLPEYRRRGHAKSALRRAAEIAASQGHARIELHVFGHNVIAQSLYRALGYEVTSMNMAVSLPSVAIR